MRTFFLATICALIASAPALSTAATTTYEYDALGRLRTVTRSDGTQTIYTLDSAGNRTQVEEAIPPSTPPSISVPTSSTNGSYSISWAASQTGTVDVYEVYESTSSSFAPQTAIYTGAATNKPISGKGDGTYYYRVRACGIQCSGYRTGGNPVVVTLLPDAPASISVPSSSSTGSYTVSWLAPPSGPYDRYELWEATNATFSGAALVTNANVTQQSIGNKTDGSYYYRVRACNNNGCGGYTTGANPVNVSLPLQTPPIPTGLTYWQNSMCSWFAQWQPSTGATSYQIRDLSGNILLTVPSTSAQLSFCGVPGYNGNPNSYRPKWVKACNSNGCGLSANF